MSINALSYLGQAQTLAATATLRIPGLMMQAAAFVSLGEFVLKGASQITNVPGFSHIHDYFDADDYNKTGQPSWGKQKCDDWGLTTVYTTLEKSVRPFKEHSWIANLGTAVGLWALSTGMLELTNVICGKPHPLYNQIMDRISWLKVQDTSVIGRSGIFKAAKAA